MPEILIDETSARQSSCTPLSFPLSSLPGPLAAFVEETACALPVDPALVALPALATASAAIGNSRMLQVKKGWIESACVYATMVSDPGAMKSPALDHATKPLKSLQGDNCRTWTSDATMESTVRLLDKNVRGLLLSRDELSGWVKSLNQYKGGKGADKEFYLSLWSGQDYAYDRVGDDGTHIILRKPYVSVIGAIPPDVLHGLNISGGEADGFLPRLLFAWPDPMPVRYSVREVSATTLSEYEEIIQALHALPYNCMVRTKVLEFTSDAQQHFITWHDEHMEQVENLALSPFLQGVYAKLKGYGVRLSLIHALCCDPTSENVGVDSLQAGMNLVEYFKGQAHKVDALFDHQQDSSLERCKAAIRRHLSVRRCMGRRELQRKLNYTGEIFQQALDQMSQAEVLIQDKEIQWNW